MAYNTHSIELAAASSQYLSAADSASLSITGDMTIELWVNPATGASPAGNGLVSKWVDAGGRSWFLDWAEVGGIPRIRFAISSTGSNGSTASTIYDFTRDFWAHLAVVYDSTTPQAIFYVNGLLQDTVSLGLTSMYDSTSTVQIGATDTAAFFNGKLDEVRIWNVMRTGTEINDNKCVQIDSATGLVASWHLDNALTDSSGNSNTLTNNNSATFSTTIEGCFPDPPKKNLLLMGCS